MKFNRWILFLAAMSLLAAPASAEETCSLPADLSDAEITSEPSAAGAGELSIREKPQYNALDYVVLGDYKGLPYVMYEEEVTDEEIDAEIADVMSYAPEAFEEQTAGEVKNGDVVNIDFVGKIDGETFDGGSAEGYDLEIGSGSFLEGFEEALVGAEVGDELEVDLTFPDDYYEEIAGKDAVFTVTIHFIKVQKELDDTLAQTLSGGKAQTVEAYREMVKEQMEESNRETRSSGAKYELLYSAVNNATMDEYPADLVAYYVDSFEASYRYYADLYGVDVEKLLQEKNGERIDFTEDAKKTIKEEFTIRAIAEAENLIPEERKEEIFDEYVKRYGFESYQEMADLYGEDEVDSEVLHSLVGTYLYENADIIEEEDAGEDLASETEELRDAEE